MPPIVLSPEASQVFVESGELIKVSLWVFNLLVIFYRFCQRRSQPLAYKPLFFFSFSQVASFLDIVLFKKCLNVLGTLCFDH